MGTKGVKIARRHLTQAVLYGICLATWRGFQAVLQGVSLEIKQGEVLALTGPSGEGKSTVASLITRLYEPHRGCITLDGIDVSTVNPSWLRRQVCRRA